MSDPERFETGLLLDAVDGLFFRGGRPLEAGYDARSTWPTPQTLAGAIRSHVLRTLGVDLRQAATTVRAAHQEGRGFEDQALLLDALRSAGAPEWALELHLAPPLPAVLGDDGALTLLYPCPQNLVWIDEPDQGSARASKTCKRRIARLDPLEEPLPGWRPGGTVFKKPLWCRQKDAGKTLKGWLTPAGAAAWLRGGVPSPKHVVEEFSALFVHEARTHVSLGAKSLTADEGMLYSMTFLRPRTDVRLADGTCGRTVFYTHVSWPAVAGALEPHALFPDGTGIFWGGERRKARCLRTPARVDEGLEQVASNAPESGFDGVARWLIGPAVFPGRFEPDHTEGLVAAAVGSPTPVSGWNAIGGHPRPNRFALPAGSVFFYAFGDGASGADAPLVKEAGLRSEGWALDLAGGWKHV